MWRVTCCHPSTLSLIHILAQKWAFSLSDTCIVLEDDDVPAVSFFGFCKELLDKYEHDPRISIIAGFNNEEITPDITSDYFFATTFSDVYKRQVTFLVHQFRFAVQHVG